MNGEGALIMKVNIIAKFWDKILVIFLAVIVLLLFRNAPAQDSMQKQPLNAGKYQALYIGEDKPGHRIIMIANTETGKVEQRILYDIYNESQRVYSYITNKEEKIK
jgi:hypothetical protein